MTTQPPEQNPSNIWRTQETGLTPMSVAEVRLKAQQVMKKTRWDLVARSAFAIVAAVFCGSVFWKSNSVVGWISGFVMLMLLAGMTRGIQLYRWKSRQLSPDSSSDTAQTSCLAFYRSELERRLAIARQPAWQILTALLIIAWLTRSSPMRSGMGGLHIVQLLVLLAAAAVVLLLAVRKFDARRIQDELATLDVVEEENP